MVRFDKPCLKVRGAVEYFRDHMGIGDYLDQKGRAVMIWFGSGAERLGLRGRCDPEEFERLCRRLHPGTGRKLTARERGSEGRVCYFGQISPPKDVSLLSLVGGDTRVRRWWDEAVRETLQEMEALAAARVRRNGADEDRNTGSLVAAVVTHDASRALDPQLHTHVAILNVTYDSQEERWKTVQPSGFYRHQGYLREVCYNRLAERLLAGGYAIEPARGLGFTISGVPVTLRERFSRRRRQILREAAARGSRSQDTLQAVAGETRDAKISASAEELASTWQAEAGAELDALRAVVASASGAGSPRPPASPAAALASAAAHVFERQSVVDERELLREALISARGRTSPAALRVVLGLHISSGALLRIGADVASPDTLAAEEEFVMWAEAHRASCPPLGAGIDPAGLSPDQAKAIEALLGSPSRVLILQGDAGTGKTTCLRAVVAAIENGGGAVFGCAPSSAAADVLRRELTPEADTLQQLLVNAELQERIRGRTLIVDEAGLVAVRQMRDLCRIAAARDCRLLLVGDTKQHAPVEAGDALRCLQKYGQVPTARLTTIRRQKDPGYRAAVALLARGDAHGAFTRFVRLGAVRELANSAELHRLAAEDYVRTIQSGRSCLAISPVWSEIHAFTAEVRARLRSAGMLADDGRTCAVVSSLGWTREQMRRVENYAPGDVVSFHRVSAGFMQGENATIVRRSGSLLVVAGPDGRQLLFDPRRSAAIDVGIPREIEVSVGERLLIRANLKRAQLRNGDVVTVTAIEPSGALILADGRRIPAGFRRFCHGYAATSHASQGRTVDRGILLLADAGLRAANLKQAYVSNSRFRESQMIYTTDKAQAREAMMRRGDRRLASDLFSATARAAVAFRNFFLHRLFNSAGQPTASVQMSGSIGSVETRASATIPASRSTQ